MVDDHGLRSFPIYDISMGCIPWYGDLGDRWLPGRDMMETLVLHMMQRWLQYVEELISWIRLFGYGYDDLGGGLLG